MRCIILQALLLTACGTMLVHGQQPGGQPGGGMSGGVEPLPYTARTTASTRGEFEARWQRFHLNASRVQVLSFDPSVGSTGGSAKFVIVGEGHQCVAMMAPMGSRPMSGGASHPGSMPPPHRPMSGAASHPGSMPPPNRPMSGAASHPGSMPPPNRPMSGGASHPGSMPPGPHCVSAGPNDLSQKSVVEIDAVLLREARVVFQQLGVFELSHGAAWTWRLVNNGTIVVKPKATFEVSVTMTAAALTAEINRVAGTEVVASAVCSNSTHSHRSGNAAITCDVEFVSSEAAAKAAASGNTNALSSVYSSSTEEGDVSTTDGIAHVSVMASVLCVCAVWALLQL